MKFLTDEWFAFVREHAGSLPVRPGASLVMQHVVSGSPAGKVHCRAEFADGRLIDFDAGKRADASCAVTWTYEDAFGALQGADLDVAFMRGSLKLDGAYRAFLLDLRPVFTSPEGVAFLEAVRGATER